MSTENLFIQSNSPVETAMSLICVVSEHVTLEFTVPY